MLAKKRLNLKKKIIKYWKLKRGTHSLKYLFFLLNLYQNLNKNYNIIK